MHTDYANVFSIPDTLKEPQLEFLGNLFIIHLFISETFWVKTANSITVEIFPLAIIKVSNIIYLLFFNSLKILVTFSSTILALI